MLKYKDIVDIKNENIKCSIESISCLLDKITQINPSLIEDEMIRQVGIFHNNHFTKETAEYIISKMNPAVGKDTIMSKLEGLSPSLVKQHILKVQTEARNYSISKSLDAPEISNDYCEWDYYVSLAMCLADFWYTGLDNIEEYYKLAYQWMSDPDAKTTKVWDYFFK